MSICPFSTAVANDVSWKLLGYFFMLQLQNVWVLTLWADRRRDGSSIPSVYVTDRFRSLQTSSFPLWEAKSREVSDRSRRYGFECYDPRRIWVEGLQCHADGPGTLPNVKESNRLYIERLHLHRLMEQFRQIQIDIDEVVTDHGHVPIRNSWSAVIWRHHHACTALGPLFQRFRRRNSHHSVCGCGGDRLWE